MGTSKKKTGEITRLQEYMDKKSITVNELSKILGVSSRTIQNTIWNNSPIGTKTLRALILKEGVSSDWLLTGKGNMSLDQQDTAQKNAQKAEEKCNLKLIRHIVESVEEVFQEKGIQAPPDKKAKLVSTLYNFYTKEGRNPNSPDREVIRDLVNSVR